MRVFVTGATGFLGRHLVRALLARGDEVVCLVRDHVCARDHHDDKRQLVYGNVTTLALLERALAEYEIDAVVHLAAQVQVSTATADPAGTLDANVRGTWCVLEASRRQKVKRVVVASSDKAYGDGVVPYTEEQPLLPHGVYATSKAAADLIAQAYWREFDIPVAITRCANLYGPEHVNWSTLIPGTIRSVIRGERPILRSDGRMERDYLYVGDAVDGYLRLLAEDRPMITHALNFGTGEARSAISVAQEILRQMGSDLEPDIQGTASARNEIDRQCVDATLARELLGWRARPFADGLAETIQWYRYAWSGR